MKRVMLGIIISAFLFGGCTLQKPKIRKLYDCLPGSTDTSRHCKLVRVKCSRGVAYSACRNAGKITKVPQYFGDRGIQAIGGL